MDHWRKCNKRVMPVANCFCTFFKLSAKLYIDSYVDLVRTFIQMHMTCTLLHRISISIACIKLNERGTSET